MTSALYPNTPTSSDLTSHLIPHLDRHLVLPLLDFLEAREAYSHQEVLKAKYDLMRSTNMVNYVLDLKRELEGESESDVVPEGEFVVSSFFNLDELDELEGVGRVGGMFRGRGGRS